MEVEIEEAGSREDGVLFPEPGKGTEASQDVILKVSGKVLAMQAQVAAQIPSSRLKRLSVEIVHTCNPSAEEATRS